MLLNHSFADAFRTYRNVSGRFPEILKHATEGEPLNVQNFKNITLTYHLPSPRTQVDRIFRRKLNPFGKRQRTNTLSTAISRSWGVGGGLHTWNLICWDCSTMVPLSPFLSLCTRLVRSWLPCYSESPWGCIVVCGMLKFRLAIEISFRVKIESNLVRGGGVFLLWKGCWVGIFWIGWSTKGGF